MKSSTASVARLNARPAPHSQSGGAGVAHLDIESKRGALLYAPESALKRAVAPLAVLLHGAGGNAEHGLGILNAYADEAKLILLAPESRKTSWDIISDAQYGPDVRFIDKCLDEVFSRYAIDPERIAIGGFSDGASYALSLGLSNGSLCRYILAFSPGFMAPVRIEGQPRIFISHGIQDQVLPIDACSRKLVRVLRGHDLSLDYREFDGAHTVPAEMKERALELFLGEAPH